jgi:ParB/RepB/Spo0J family partition protein
MSTPSAVHPEFRAIPLALIDEPQLPSRTEMDETKMEQLVAAIRSDGFLSVVNVVQRGERYEVVAGHRRTIAARRAGLVALPCYIHQPDSPSLKRVQHTENARREELSVTDEAIWFQQLLDEQPGDGTDGVCALVGETRAYVEGRLALLQGCMRVFEALSHGEISIGVAQQLNKCTEDAHRYMLLDTAIRSGAKVGVVAQWVSDWRTIHAPAAGITPNGPPITPGPAPIVNDYFRCRVCGEKDNPGNMQPVQVHDYCLQPLIDKSTGFFRSRADYVTFPTTREDAVALIHRLLVRFPELANGDAARS